ncbi:MAG: HAD-IA family hydrolase, partial [Actinomycetota bacterium]
MVHSVSPLRVVLFDVDGTLVDSERSGHRVAFNRSFEELGLPYRWDEDLYGELLLVTGGKERIDHYLRGEGIAQERRAELVPEIHEKKNRYFLDLVEQGAVPARPGAARLIDELGAAGMRLGVVTTGSRGWVETIVAQHFGLDRFEIVVTGDQVPRKKPDPSAYEIALDRLDLQASSALALEDSLPG